VVEEDLAVLSLTLCTNMNSQSWVQQAPVAVGDTKTSAETDEARARSLLANARELRNIIRDKLDRNPIGISPAGHYMPDGELERLFTIAAVQCALGGVNNYDLVDFVLQKAKKVFATLLLVFPDCENRKRAMEAFRSTSFTDENLSSTAFELNSAALELCPELCKHDDGMSSHHFPFYDPWDRAFLNDFKSKRWHFLIPKLDHTIFEYRLDAQQFLPYRRGNLPAVFDGNFSEVTCVEMLNSKQTKIISQSETIIIALKTLKRINVPQYDIRREWQREATAHKHLNGTHAHLV
jgi:hypothetical protein